jgi:hypothetical protein
MSEIDLRALVRDAVRRHIGQPTTAGPSPASSESGGRSLTQGLYVALVNQTDDCLIEPSVRCNHCGYCKTHGY